MLKKNLLLMFLLCGFYFPTFGQTGFTEDFNSQIISTDWWPGTSYNLNQASGILNISVNKNSGWDSFGRNIPLIDVSSNPYVNMKVKTDQDITLDVYLVDVNNNNLNIGRRISRADNFINICWDFSSATAIDLTKISKLYFAVNGMALTYIGNLQFDDLKVGTDAQKISNFSGIPNLSIYQNAKNYNIFLQGLQNVQSLSFASQPKLLNNISYGAITPDGKMTIEFDATNLTGSENLTLESTGNNGWLNNTYNLDLIVNGNQPPTLNLPDTFKCKVGVTQNIPVTNISDGDKTARQNLTFNLLSDNENVISANSQFIYTQDEPDGYIQFVAKQAGIANVIVTANDGQATNNLTSRGVQVISYNEWNEKPTLDDISPITIYNNSGVQALNLTGISDGDGKSQTLSFTISNSNNSLISDPDLLYTKGSSTGILNFSPQIGKIGIDTILITITDNGGNLNNNGNQSITKKFIINIQAPPLTGYIIPLTDYIADRASRLWHIEGEGTAQTIDYEKDGSDDVLHINCLAKSTWTGLWYGFSKQMLNLTQNPYITMWVKSDHAIQFTLYFWDYNYQRNNMAVPDIKSIPANTWTKVAFDFYGKMVNSNSVPISADKIDSVLFNYHPAFTWPFTNFAGNVWFKDIRIGDKADSTFNHPKVCTINDIANLTIYSNSTVGAINLDNISDGNNGPASVSVVSSNGAILQTLSVSPINGQAATINYTLSGTTGVTTITVTTSANGSNPTVKTFTINVLPSNPTTISTITIDLSTKYQKMHGIGTFVDESVKPYFNQYVNDFGGTVARLGVTGNQIEPINDNDDPYVLDRSALNYNAFDWDFYKSLKEKGVEHFILTVWSMPAWMKENASEDFFMSTASTWEGTPNRVDTLMYEEYAENIVATVLAFKEKAGIDLYGIGLQNEPAFNEPYASAVLSPRLFTKLINIVGKRFEMEGIKCKLYMAEQVLSIPIYPWSDYLNSVQNDPTAWKYTDVQAVHGYTGDGITAYTANCSQWSSYSALVQTPPHPKEFWMTETEPVSTTWDNVLSNIGAMSTAFSCGNVSWWSQWGFNDHFITQGKSNQLAYAQSQFAKFVKPEAVRVSATTNDANLLVTSFVNTIEHGNTLATVVVNKSTSPINIKLTGTNIPSIFDTYQTYYLQNFKYAANGAKKDSVFLLPPQSITTFTSQLPNAAPTINTIPDQVISMNSAEQVITLSGITDGGEGNQTITITPSVLTGTTLISNVHIDYYSPDSIAKLYYTPINGKFGNASIQIVVNDNSSINNTTSVNCNIQILNTTTINKVTENGLNIFPNPASDYIRISTPDATYKSVAILNLMGEIIFQKSLTSQNSVIDITNLKSGIYLMLVKGDSGKLIKQFIKK